MFFSLIHITKTISDMRRCNMSKPKLLHYFGSLKTIISVTVALQKNALYSFETITRDSLHKVKQR